MQPMLNPNANQYYTGYMSNLPPEAYPNQMYPSGEMPLQMPMGNAGYQEQEQKNVLPDSAPNQMMLQMQFQQPFGGAGQTSAADQMKPKQKRRSKNEVNGRDYICGCGKTYLSYPALYTHIKTKHNGQNPCGTQQLQTGRGRGRPRKVRLFIINRLE